MKRWADAELEPWRLTAERQYEAAIQQQAKAGLVALGFDIVADMSQGRQTRQEPGIFDLYMLHLGWGCIGWCEMKVPGLWRPSIGDNYRVHQRQGQRTYEQERWQTLHQALRQSCIHAYTADSADEVIAYWAWAGYPVPKDMYRYAYRPERDHRFTNPHAKPRALLTRSIGRKTPHRRRR